MTCSNCGRAITGAARFCHDCGESLDPSQASPTRTHLGGAQSTSAPRAAGSGRAAAARSLSESSADSLDHGRFVPGTLFLERYRILGLLGRGGMGEVYRADDLKLGQPVALKFLPPELAQDPSRLARFHGEVRLARQVSHPNVCRVYDIGEIDGQTFLTMEYIDGEDLATLLRRIGRLPKDKAIEIARQLCAGLAAAHDRGVLHRDLKPANVMLDGRGRARLTDFGLAGIAGSAEAAGTRAGTPAYMSPEQLQGGEATVRSDLFALGLVLYELFTGKRAFQGDTLAELARSRAESAPTPPASLVEGFDPAVERVILRCLEPDPRQRPATALAVAAALPGGDPLAMALAAGETPSPEMVAAAGEAGGLRPSLVWLCLAVVAVATLGALRIGERTLFLRKATLPKSPEVLDDRAQEVIRALGYPEPPADRVHGFGWHRSYSEYVRDHDASVTRWERFKNPQPSAIYFWYRQSPRPFEPGNVEAQVTLDDPAPIRPGMASVSLTAAGDLWHFDAVPPQLDEGGEAVPVDWRPVFALAGLSFDGFKEVTPRWVPSAYGDTRAAWEGAYAGAPEYPVHVEAAAYRGRPVYFYVYWPWSRALRTQPFAPTTGERIASHIILSMIVSAIVAGLVLARRNLRQNRVDRRGAFRLALFVFVVSLGALLSQARHSGDPWQEWGVLVRLFGNALFDGGVVWIYYAALEPHVRRRWPDRIISWTRLLSGRTRDPMVGRDVLIGIALGTAMAFLGRVQEAAPAWLGLPPPIPSVNDLDMLAGPLSWLAALLTLASNAISNALGALFILVLLRVLLRRQWAGVAVLWIISTTVASLAAQTGWTAVLAGAVMGAVLTMALVRFGVLTLSFTFLVWWILAGFPTSLDLTSWYGLPALFGMLVIAALTVVATRTALAGRSLFELRLLEEN
jgi:predicted Ser/Thr protein kinase